MPNTLEAKIKNYANTQSTKIVYKMPKIGYLKTQPKTPNDSRPIGRRRTLARMMRVDLEITLGLLDEALDHNDESS